MFRALFRQAQETVESSITEVVVRALLAIPFLIAIAFASAALTIKLRDAYGGVIAMSVMAGVFALMGLIATAFHAARRSRSATAADVVEEPASAGVGVPEDVQTGGMSDTERDLLMAALTSAAPVAIPQLARLILRNLPILAALAAALFIITRPSVAGTEPNQPDVPDGAGLAPAE